MKKLLLLLACLYAPYAFAQKEPIDKTLSPYFWVKSKNSKVDQMPLKHTEANVNIAGTIADVRITQIYKNEGKEALEAVYLFPGSTRAAVYGMTMTIGSRKLIAKIEEKNKARAQYETAKEEGKTASLLEQINPNVFQMNVANILPNDEIKVELRYTEMLEPTEGVYEFAYPTVVGPRYSETPANPVAANSEKWVENPYTKEGKEPLYTFDFKAVLNAGLPIQEITCLSHKTDIQYAGKNLAKIDLAKKEKEGGNRDVIVRYRLAGGQVETGMMLYEGENATASAEEGLYNAQSEKFFMVMMQPPKAPTDNQIPPREYVFIVDVSGSMHGFPLTVTKVLLKNLIGKLRPTDRFNVMLFESNNQMMGPESMPATQANIDKAIDVINQQRGSGGTRLLPALQNAMGFKESAGFSRSFVVVTDGYVTVEKEAFELIRSKLNEANLFAFGIGSSVNRYLIEGMAHVGQGEPFFVYNENEADKIAQKFQKYIEHPVLTRIHIKYDGFEAYDIEPMTVPDVFAERPILIYGKYKGNAKGTITLTGISGNQPYTKTFNVSEANNQNTQAIRYLWARNKIRQLYDFNRLYASQEQVKTITDLGLRYNLLTEYTSFIAIDNEVRNNTGKLETIKQPLPLPEGVTNHAIGNTRGGQLGSTNAPMRGGELRTAKAPMKSADHTREKGKKMHAPSNKDVPADMPKVEELKSKKISVETKEEAKPKERQKEIAKIEIEDIKLTKKDGIVEEITLETPLRDSLQVYTVVQQQPEFIGGNKALNEFLKANLKYPKDGLEMVGKVFVSFIVGRDGKLRDIKILRGLSKAHDEEALRLVTLMQGMWQAGKQNGNAVAVSFHLPIIFESK